MSKKKIHLSRRGFLKTAAAAGAALAAPHVVSSSVLGKDGAVAPSEKITLGAMGIGGRGGYDLGCILREDDVQVVAVCDVRGPNRKRAKAMVDGRYGNENCTAYIDFREMFARKDIDAVLIATGNNWHGLASILAAKAGKDVYSEKPCTRNIVESLELADTFQRTGRVYQGGMQRRNLPHFQYCIELAQRGKLGKLVTLHAHGGGHGTGMSEYGAGNEQEPPREEVAWDLYLGPAAWRPYSKRFITGHFDKGGGMVGGGVQEWGSHCVDLCQWANSADRTFPVEYEPTSDGASCRYANGVKLIIRDGGWMNSGSCPVRYEGETGWVETGDSGDIFASSQGLLAGRGAKQGGYPADSHIRDFFNCVKTRGLPKANHFVACNTHIACHAAGISLFLGRKVTLDPVKIEFVADEEANRLRTEAIREPWRI